MHEFSHEEDDYNYNNNRSSSNGGGGGGAGGWSNAAAERTEYSNTYDEMRRMRRHLRTQYRDMKKLLKMQHKSMVPLLVKEHARLNPDRPSPVGVRKMRHTDCNCCSVALLRHRPLCSRRRGEHLSSACALTLRLAFPLPPSRRLEQVSSNSLF